MKGNKWKRLLFLVIIIYTILLTGVFYLFLYRRSKIQMKELSFQTTVTHANVNYFQKTLPFLKRKDEIIILYWTKYYGYNPLLDVKSGIKSEIENHLECFKNCRFTNDRRLLAISDAVNFHERDLNWQKNDFPAVHRSNQLWIFTEEESPSYTESDLTEYANIFNWTMSYRRDSDVWNPYGLIVKRKTSIGPNNWTSNYGLEERKKMILWIVSNCETEGKREIFVDRLQLFLPVDVYGKCGTFNCSNDLPGECLPNIAPQYKFYLAFENSMCWDYVTEKFYNALKYNLVPIVFGGANYATFAPPNSFIDASKFESVKALADYLRYLNENDEKYLQYFKWKPHYQIENSASWCRLCKKVKEHKKNPQQKIYKNLWKWWHTKSARLVTAIRSFNDTNDVATDSLNDHAGNDQSSPESPYSPACVDLIHRFDPFDRDYFLIKFKKIKKWLFKTFWE